MSNLKLINDDEDFEAALKAAGDDLVIIDFYTSWCRPCKSMEPVFQAMAMHYPKALFLKVDADKCFETAMKYKVSGVPFFVIYFNKTAVETVQGANPKELELKIRLAEIESRKAVAAVVERSRSNGPALNPTISTFGKLGSVAQYVDHENSHCLNDLSPTSFNTFIQGKKLVSGKGTGKLLIVYSFTQKMMLQSFKIRASPQLGPKVLRFFVNHPKVLDFNVGSTLAPSQEVTLSYHDLSGERAIELRSGSFQVVTNVQIFITSGQSSKITKLEIDSLQLFGAPIIATQPLNAIDSVLSSPKPRPTTSTNANTKPPPPGPPNTATHQHQPSANDNNSDTDDEESTCQAPGCFTKQYIQEQQHRQTTPSAKHRSYSGPNYANAATVSYAAAPLPGHSKYLVQDGNEQANVGGVVDRQPRTHHHKPQPGDKDHHHHHSHSRHHHQ